MSPTHFLEPRIWESEGDGPFIQFGDLNRQSGSARSLALGKPVVYCQLC